MVFSSFTFLFAFLPLALAAYYLSPARAKNAVLLAASLFFYAWGAPRFVLVLVGATWVDWMISRAIAAAPSGSARRRQWLVGSLVLNLGLLGWFKYANFAASQVRQLGSRAGLRARAVGGGRAADRHLVLHLPQDQLPRRRVPRRRARPRRSFGLYLLYICPLPAADRRPDRPLPRRRPAAASARTTRVDRFLSGVCRFCLGLAKKVLIANVLGETADRSFDAPAGSLYPAVAWIGVLAYSFQIYFDFSGYSDMAIGLGPHVRLRVPRELRPALPLAQLHGVLAALAHLALPLHARLPLHPARRQPAGRGRAATSTCGSCSCSRGSGTARRGRSSCGAPTTGSS